MAADILFCFPQRSAGIKKDSSEQPGPQGFAQINHNL
jgi:hypothetical protein